MELWVAINFKEQKEYKFSEYPLGKDDCSSYLLKNITNIAG